MYFSIFTSFVHLGFMAPRQGFSISDSLGEEDCPVHNQNIDGVAWTLLMYFRYKEYTKVMQDYAVYLRNWIFVDIFTLLLWLFEFLAEIVVVRILLHLVS